MVCLWVDVSNCDIPRPSQFLNITHHNCDNSHDYKHATTYDKLMQQVMFDYTKCVYIHAWGSQQPFSNHMTI